MNTKPIAGAATRALALTAHVGYWGIRHHFRFRSRVRRDFGFSSIRPRRLRSWNLGGAIYRCSDPGGRPLFVKVAAFPALVRNEVEALQTLEARAPLDVAIPQLRYYALEPPYPFVALDWINAPSLEETIRHKFTIDAEHLADALVRALDMLDAAEIVHRDITPRNLLITGGTPGLVLSDFAFSVRPDTAAARDAEIPVAALCTLGDGFNPEPFVWDDAWAALGVIDWLESLGYAIPAAVRRELEMRVGRRSLRAAPLETPKRIEPCHG